MGSQISTRVKVIRPDEAPGDDSNEQRPNSSLGLQSDDPSINSSVSFAGRESGHRSSIQRQETEASKGTILCTPALGSGYELEDSDGNRKPLSEDVLDWFQRRNRKTLEGSLAFVPWILQQSYFDGGLEEGSVVTHRGSGAVVFSDASGFTALTERLAKKSNGAELLSQCLTAFFTPLINLINAYRGDVIKFSGDALTIYFPAVDDTTGPRSTSKMQVPPHGSYGLPDLGPMTTAVLRASACCLEIHKRLHMFDTGVDDVRLCLHIGVGCGQVTILQVGGVVPPETHVARCEYLIAGPPIEQISIAEPLAKNGETCLSPQAWDHVRGCVVEDTSRALDDRPEYHLLLKMDESKYTFPTIKYSAMERDTRREKQFALTELSVIRRYIPSAVFKQIEGGTLTYVNEMRTISTIFISGSGVDVSTDAGALVAQELMASVQRICYAMEGTLNKFVIDDKGMLFLLVFGLPPLVHPDDPTRAVLACLEFVQVFKKLELVGRFGVTTGRCYCGSCGSAKRMEYTVLGDCVNLSARLMSNAPPLGVLADEETCRHSTGEISFKALSPIKVKGKANPIPVFKPSLREAPPHIGLTQDRTIRFPWYDHPIDGSSVTSTDVVSVSKAKVTQLCSVNKWAGISKVMDMLGGTFNRQLHEKDKPIQTTQPPRTKAPVGSPFADGGIVVIEGPTGIGKIELAEHIVMHCATQFHMMPIFGTMGPRPGESTRMAVELLRSTVGVFRLLDPTIPGDDVRALQALAKDLKDTLPKSVCTLTDLLQNPTTPNGDRDEIFETAVKVVIALLTILKKTTMVVVVLQFEHGTSLFSKTTAEDKAIFWNMTAQLTKLVQKEKQIAGLILCHEAEQDNVAVKHAMGSNSFVKLTGLNGENVLEYMCNYLQIPESGVPPPLRRFVTQVTLGNPLYIRETLDQLKEEQHLKLLNGSTPSVVLTKGALDGIDIAAWNHTMMVGGTQCLLESLDPIEAAALKMSTCFEGTFTLTDLAASTCSQWGGATHFDLLRLFKATRKLIKMGIIEETPHPGAPKDSSKDSGRTSEKDSAVSLGIAPPTNAEDSKETPRSSDIRTSRGDGSYESTCFQMQNVLIRTVGAAMLLDAQKKSVKRNALIDRVLKKELPKRMVALAAKNSLQHIPWYYERALRRMP